MNKKGFTLIELLAVIVILAIIAVIAVPIVLNIIDESKKNASLRSADFYLDAVELSIANRVMNQGAIPNKAYPIMSDGNICLEEYDNEKDECKNNDNIEGNEILEVEVNGEGPTKGTVIIENGQIVNKLSTDSTKKTQLVIGGQTITKNEDNEFVIVGPETYDNKIEVGKFNSVCKIASDSTVTGTNAGAKYNCKVDPNKDPYTFFVLTAPLEGDSTINLIMDSNIRTGGEPVKDSNSFNSGYVAWNSDDTTSNGPIAAMDYLQTATETWTNSKTITVNTFTDDSGNVYNMSKTYNTYARLPYYSEVSNSNGTNEYLYDYLSHNSEEESITCWQGEGEHPKHDANVDGYWTLTCEDNDSDPSYAFFVFANGYVFGPGYYQAHESGINGVRPVITLDL